MESLLTEADTTVLGVENKEMKDTGLAQVESQQEAAARSKDGVAYIWTTGAAWVSLNEQHGPLTSCFRGPESRVP